MDTSNTLKGYQNRLIILNIIDTPFFIALVLGIMAYFNENAVLPFLENETYALYTIVIGAIGSAIGISLSFYTAKKIKTLSNAEKQ